MNFVFCEKMGFWKWEFCKNWDFENVNFMKNEFFENVNFVKNEEKCSGKKEIHRGTKMSFDKKKLLQFGV